MEKFFRLGVVSGFLLLAAFIVLSNSAQASLSSGENASSETIVSPRSLFIQNCSRCHGTNGKAQTALGKKLEADDLTSTDAKALSTAKIVRTITNGRGDMPRFGKKLTAAQIKSIAGYIRSL
ncbi:MAG: c-type cytochrome [Acidobacteriota bacterium]